jgi:lipoprotein-anchoring transpeptidase ErfK/SrfK
VFAGRPAVAISHKVGEGGEMRPVGAERLWRSAADRGRGGERLVVAVVAGLLAGLLVGCTGGAAAPTGQAADQRGGQAAPGGAGEEGVAPEVPPARLAVRPANGARDVSPATPVSVVAAAGTLTAVTLRNPSGKRVRGTLSADRARWVSAEPLAYAKTYAVSATAVNSAGKSTTVNGRFSTVTPVTYTMPTLFPGSDRRTVGIGQPITVHFDEAITDKAAAERALTVTASPPTQGGWYWFDSQNAHWRPMTYWRPGTRVTVTAKLYGVHVGGGIYGQQDAQSSFTIGPARVFTIDDRTHSGVVRINGRVVRHIPVSLGMGGSIVVKGQRIFFTTQSGPHVVQEKYPVKRMSSASYGLPVNTPKYGYEDDIPLAVRVSASGEFVHAASWSVDDQGVRNVSHGCINISPANADWFYRTFSYGDIVDIKNTGVPLARSDKYGDWMIPWSEWRAGSALR